ncbi:hypothetical protein [uncultured Enterococcus sp.]|uniref:hypothetical protein n=1 Tax=uncultured Enterococcus sp. TaxID=167972 RepID=UPI0028059FF6|nr:hypothetical protein [uncultured Enterococcus sp.]
MPTIFKEVRKLSDEELVLKFAEVEGKKRNTAGENNLFLYLLLKREIKKRRLMVRIY